MFFILSLLITGVITFFLPQWMYKMSWAELFECVNPNTASSKISELIKKLGITHESITDVAREKIITVCVIALVIFILTFIFVNAIKKDKKKN